MSWGPVGLFVLAVLDSAGIPVVGGVDVLLVTVSVREPQLAYLAAVASISGSLIGSSVLFAIARKGGEVLLAKYIYSRQGARLHSWFESYGMVTVFVPALSPIPLPLKIPVICAGALEVRWSHFLWVMLLARSIRYFALAYLGRSFGPDSAHFLAEHWVAVTAIAIILAAVAVRILKAMDRRQGPEAVAD